MLFGVCGDSSHAGQLGDSLELSLHVVLEEGRRLGKSEERRWRLESPSAAAVVILTEMGKQEGAFSQCQSDFITLTRYLRRSVGDGRLVLLTALKGSVDQRGKVWAEQLTSWWAGSRAEQHQEEA